MSHCTRIIKVFQSNSLTCHRNVSQEKYQEIGGHIPSNFGVSKANNVCRTWGPCSGSVAASIKHCPVNFPDRLQINISRRELLSHWRHFMSWQMKSFNTSGSQLDGLVLDLLQEMWGVVPRAVPGSSSDLMGARAKKKAERKLYNKSHGEQCNNGNNPLPLKNSDFFQVSNKKKILQTNWRDFLGDIRHRLSPLIFSVITKVE